MGWRVAGSLETLRDQADAAWPDRSRASDGTIGDAAHQASVSDHNPDPGGVVRALDITHDPEHGCDIGRLSDAIAAARDPRVSYVIANQLITGPDYGWQWTPYDGDDPHTGHLHLSVVGDGRADDRRLWDIGEVAVSKGEDMDATQNQMLINIHAWLAALVSGDLTFPGGTPHLAGRPVSPNAQVQHLLDRPATTAPELTAEQLTAIGAAAAAAAGKAVSEQIAALEARMDTLIGARRAAAGAEHKALAP